MLQKYFHNVPILFLRQHVIQFMVWLTIFTLENNITGFFHAMKMLIGWFIVISWFPWLQIQRQCQTYFYLKALSCKFEIWKKKSLIIYMYVCLGSIFANIIIFDKPKNIQKIDRLVKNRHIADVTHSIKRGTVSPFVIQSTSDLVQTADIAWQLNFVVVPDKKLGIIFPLKVLGTKYKRIPLIFSLPVYVEGIHYFI